MAPHHRPWRRFALASTCLLAFTGLPTLAWAQDDPEAPPAPDAPAPEAPVPETPPTLEGLQERLAELEARLAEMEKPADTPDEAVAEEDAEPETAGVSVDLPYGTKVKLGGAIRVRGEYRTPQNHFPIVRTAGGAVMAPGGVALAGTSERDADFALLRTRIHLDVTTLEHVRAFIELQDSRTFGDTGPNSLIGEGGPAGDFGVHVRQSYLEVFDLIDDLSVKVGRFAFPDLGDYRLLSSLDWSNVTRSLDGAQITFDPKGWMLTAFAGNIRESQALDALGVRGSNRDNWIYTLYASCRLVENYEFDGYLIVRDFNQGAAKSTTRREEYTVGVRFKGKNMGLNYSGELAWQSGEQFEPASAPKTAGNTHIDAWMTAWTLGYTLKIDDDFKIGFGGEYSYASGDKRDTDHASETFSPIYPFGHFYLGHMDEVAFSNVHSAKLMFKVEPMKALSFNMHLHSFWRARHSRTGGDFWYSVNDGIAQNGPTATTHQHIGWEVDLFAKYKLWDHLAFWGGYSHFEDSRGVRKNQNFAGIGNDARNNMDWFFLQAEFKF